jgi:glycosyltransferase involved in cell wall biosynthesis
VYRWQGRQYTEDLWRYDLVRHLDYIADLRLFCPVFCAQPPRGFTEIPATFPAAKLTVHDVRPATSTLHALLLAPSHLASAWRAVGDVQIVHGGAIGWPIPLGYYTALAARLRGRFHICVMESSPWRPSPGQRPGVLGRLRAGVMERMARSIARQSDLALFTTREYQLSMTGAGHAASHVFKASWITEQTVIGTDDNKARWAERTRRPRLVVGFAARLVEEKGLRVLLEALRQLAASRTALEVVVFGEGPMTAEVNAAAASLPAPVSLRFAGKVEYGQPFFAALDELDLVVVPSLSDEQPRIVYDSFSRGIPVVASRTKALAECIAEGVDGLLFDVGDATGLAAVLADCARDREALPQMGAMARESALGQTHERMHADRKALIELAWLKWESRRTRQPNSPG